MIIRNIPPMPFLHIIAYQCSREAGYVYKSVKKAVRGKYD